jgi:uncharacterized protein YybS (DUF2232 family)
MSKDIVTGTLITCLTVTACALVPIIGLMGSALIPVPLVFYRAKLGSRAGAAIAGASLAYVVVLGGGGLEVLFFGSLLLLGTVMGELLARGWPLELTVSVSCGAVVAAGAAGLWAHGLFTGLGFLGTLAEGVRNNLELTLRLYRDMGLSQDQIQFLESSMDVIQQVMIGMLPALVIGSCLMTVWVSFLSVRVLFRRKGLPLGDYGPLDHWKAPEVLVWVVIACGILLLLPSLVAKTIGLNGLVVLMIVYFFQGMAIIAYFFRRKKVPRGARILVYALIGLQQLVMLGVVVVGFFDMWFNFRKIGKPLAPA